MTKTPTIWDKIDPSILVTESKPSSSGKASPSDRRGLTIPRLWLLDIVAIPLWLYFVLQLFVFDVDDYVFEDLLGLDFNPADYRLFIALALLVVVVLFARKYWFVILYVLLYPLVILFWKLPRLIYKTRSWLFLLVVINVIANFLRNFKYIVVSVALSSTCILAVVVADTSWILVAAAVTLFVLLAVNFVRVVISTFSGSRFVRAQQAVIRRVTDSDLVWTFAQVDESLKDPGVTRFDEAQLNSFAGKVSTGLLVHRGLYFWAYQLDRYRMSPAPSYFSCLSYVWLFAISVITFWMANLAILKIDPSGFEYSAAPSNLQMLLYTLRTFAFGGLETVVPIGNMQLAVSIAAGVVGGLLLATLAANLILASRTQRQAAAVSNLVTELKTRANSFESRLAAEYQIPLSEAITRLEQMGRGFIRWVAYLLKDSARLRQAQIGHVCRFESNLDNRPLRTVTDVAHGSSRPLSSGCWVRWRRMPASPPVRTPSIPSRKWNACTPALRAG